MPVRIDIKVVEVCRSAADSYVEIAIVGIAIFDLAVDIAADQIFDARAGAKTVESRIEILGEAGAVICIEAEPGIGVAALDIEQRIGADRRADTRADLEIALRLEGEAAARAERVVLGLAGGGIGDFALNAENDRIADRHVIPGTDAVEEALEPLAAAIVETILRTGRKIAVIVGTGVVVTAQRLDPEAGKILGIGPGIRLGHSGRGNARRQDGDEKKRTHFRKLLNTYTTP
jgi:hypothetical protein